LTTPVAPGRRSFAKSGLSSADAPGSSLALSLANRTEPESVCEMTCWGEARRDQAVELGAGGLRAQNRGPHGAGTEELGLGLGGGRGGRQEGRDHDDVVAGELARWNRAGEAAGVENDHAAAVEPVAALLVKAGQAARGQRALVRQAAVGAGRIGGEPQPDPGARTCPPADCQVSPRDPSHHLTAQRRRQR
jgi:hypothetical protein